MTVRTGRPLGSPPRIPRAVLAYGLLGLLPFLACPLAVALAPGLQGAAAVLLAGYAALILSFLGGARWGLAVREAAPRPEVVGLAMLPTLAGLALLTLTGVAPRLQFLGLAAALLGVCAWDIRSAGLPGWYAPLRTILTAGAVAGLAAGAVGLPG